MTLWENSEFAPILPEIYSKSNSLAHLNLTPLVRTIHCNLAQQRSTFNFLRTKRKQHNNFILILPQFDEMVEPKSKRVDQINYYSFSLAFALQDGVYSDWVS